jgi:short-subunit dehydrogenase
MKDDRRVALITGASAGIGEAFAHVFAAHDFDLVVTARREDRLRALASVLEEQHRIRVHVMPADLSQPDAPARLVDRLAAAQVTVDALVNTRISCRSCSWRSPSSPTACCRGWWSDATDG